MDNVRNSREGAGSHEEQAEISSTRIERRYHNDRSDDADKSRADNVPAMLHVMARGPRCRENLHVRSQLQKCYMDVMGMGRTKIYAKR